LGLNQFLNAGIRELLSYGLPILGIDSQSTKSPQLARRNRIESRGTHSSYEFWRNIEGSVADQIVNTARPNASGAHVRPILCADILLFQFENSACGRSTQIQIRHFLGKGRSDSRALHDVVSALIDVVSNRAHLLFVFDIL
jgi:hypothetical protein